MVRWFSEDSQEDLVREGWSRAGERMGRREGKKREKKCIKMIGLIVK